MPSLESSFRSGPGASKHHRTIFRDPRGSKAHHQIIPNYAP